MPGKRLIAQVSLAGTKETPKPALQMLSVEYTSGNLFIVSPNGGEQLIMGTTHQIAWSALGHDTTYPVKLSYSLDNGKTYKVIIESTENDGTHVWVLPEHVSSEDVLVKVSDRNDPTLFDASDETFTILSAEAAKQRRAEEAAQEAAQQAEVTYTDDLLTLLDELTKEPNATPHDLVIKVTESGGYEAGDIVMIRPSGSEWSETEKNSFLIIQADLSPAAVMMLMDAQHQHKFKIDMSYFDLKPRKSDKGKPPVRRHYRAKEDLRMLLEDRAEPAPAAPTQPAPPNVSP